MRSILFRVLYDICAPAAALLIVSAFLLTLRVAVGSAEAGTLDLVVAVRCLAAAGFVAALMVFLRKKRQPQTFSIHTFNNVETLGGSRQASK